MLRWRPWVPADSSGLPQSWAQAWQWMTGRSPRQVRAMRPPPPARGSPRPKPRVQPPAAGWQAAVSEVPEMRSRPARAPWSPAAKRWPGAHSHRPVRRLLQGRVAACRFPDSSTSCCALYRPCLNASLIERSRETARAARHRRGERRGGAAHPSLTAARKRQVSGDILHRFPAHSCICSMQIRGPLTRARGLMHYAGSVATLGVRQEQEGLAHGKASV